MNYYRHFDHEQFRCDFLCRFPRCAYQKEIQESGDTVYHVVRRSKNPIRYYKEIITFFHKNGKSYDVLWDNECMFNDITPLALAYSTGIPIRIAHSHNSGNMDTRLKGRIQGFLHHVHKQLLTVYATDLWACSRLAGEWAFPANVLSSTKYRIIRNAIDIDHFSFHPDIRTFYRKQLGLDDHFTIGCVGRLQYQKNQTFLLDAFARFLNHPQGRDSRLLLIGTGPDRSRLLAQAASLGIEESVIFLGYRPDVECYLQAMDVFALPSRFEGLGIAVIEAQCCGLPCLVSNAIPQEAAVTELVRFLPITNMNEWVASLSQIIGNRPARSARHTDIDNAGYGIVHASKELCDLLSKRVNGVVHD